MNLISINSLIFVVLQILDLSPQIGKSVSQISKNGSNASYEDSDLGMGVR